MKISMLLLCVVLLCILTIGGATRPVIAPVPAPAITPPCTDSMDSIPSCPDTGCGENGDALLNQAKDRFDAVPQTSVTDLTLSQMRAISEPAHWDTGQVRTPLASHEGKAIAITGFLLKARAEGAESCNCGRTRRADTDIHLILVSRMPDAEDPDAVANSEMHSVTAEITPRVRQLGHPKHPDWVFKNINDFEGDYVRLSGRLMLDTKHIPQTHLLPHERRNKGLKRATNWEVHPVTRFQVCNGTKSQCDHGTHWDDVP